MTYGFWRLGLLSWFFFGAFLNLTAQSLFVLHNGLERDKWEEICWNVNFWMNYIHNA